MSKVIRPSIDSWISPQTSTGDKTKKENGINPDSSKVISLANRRHRARILKEEHAKIVADELDGSITEEEIKDLEASDKAALEFEKRRYSQFGISEKVEEVLRFIGSSFDSSLVGEDTVRARETVSQISLEDLERMFLTTNRSEMLLNLGYWAAAHDVYLEKKVKENRRILREQKRL